METVVNIHFFINMELGHHLLVKQLVSYLELTYISSEQSPVEYCTTLHEEHLLVPSEMMKEGFCFSPYCLKLTTVVRWYLSLGTVLAGKMLKCLFMLFKPRLNPSGSVYGQIVILKSLICDALVRLVLWKQGLQDEYSVLLSPLLQ